MLWYIFLFVVFLVVIMGTFKLGVKFGFILGRKVGFTEGRKVGYREGKRHSDKGELFVPHGTEFDKEFLKESGAKW